MTDQKNKDFDAHMRLLFDEKQAQQRHIMRFDAARRASGWLASAACSDKPIGTYCPYSGDTEQSCDDCKHPICLFTAIEIRDKFVGDMLEVKCFGA